MPPTAHIRGFPSDPMMSARRPDRLNSPSENADRQRLCLGGSFDPIHVGHLITARAAAEAVGLRGVRLIPAASNPHKRNGPLASAGDRLAMCRLAVDGDPFFVVDPIELDRPPPSYTIDTVTAIAGDSGVRVPWLIGSDLLARLPTWHRFDELLDHAELIVMRRAGHPIELVQLDPRVARLAGRAIDVPAIDVSATAIRAAVAMGGVATGLPSLVADYIEAHRLYRSSTKW